MRAAAELTFEANLHQTLLSDMNMARKKGFLCDTKLVTGERTILAHKVVLAHSCSYFRDIYLGSLKKSKSDVDSVGIDNVDPESVEIVLDFMYTGKAKIPAHLVRDVLQLCSKFGLNDLAEACLSFISKEVLPNDVFGLRAFATENSFRDLTRQVDEFIHSNFQSIYLKKDFLLLPRLEISLMSSGNRWMEVFENPDYISLFEKIIGWVRKRLDLGEKLSNLLEETNMLYMQSDQLLKDCALDDIDEIIDYNSNENIERFKRQTSRSKGEDLNLPEKKNLRRSKEFKLIAALHISEQSYIGLLVLEGQLVAVSVHCKARATSSSASLSSDSSCYDEAALNSSLTMLSPMAIGRCSAGVTSFDGRIFVVGGYNRGNCLKGCEYYDPELNEWTEVPALSVSRARLEAAVIGKSIYAVGGSDGHYDLDSVEVFDTEEVKWEAAPSMLEPRSSFGLTASDGKLYVISGMSENNCLRTAEMYDTTTRQWTYLPHLNMPRAGCCAVVLNGKIYAIGGSHGWNCHNAVEVYDPVEMQWNEVASMSVSRRGASAAVFKGKIIVAGGSDGKVALKCAECYDPNTNSWHPFASLTNCRNNTQLVVVNDVLYAVGGFGGSTATEFLNTIEFYDSENDDWRVYIPG